MIRTHASPCCARRHWQHFVAVVTTLFALGCTHVPESHWVAPEIELQPGESGRVGVRALVDQTGHVVKVELQSSSGNPRLDAAALAVVPKWKLVPAQQDGKPVASWTLIPFVFKADDPQ